MQFPLVHSWHQYLKKEFSVPQVARLGTMQGLRSEAEALRAGHLPTLLSGDSLPSIAGPHGSWKRFDGLCVMDDG